MLRQSVSHLFPSLAGLAIGIALLMLIGSPVLADTPEMSDAGNGEVIAESSPTEAGVATTEAATAEADFRGGTAQRVEELTELKHWPNATRASDVAVASDQLNIIITAICLIFGVPIFIVTIVFVVMFRRREGRMEPEPSPSHSTPLELTWSIIPLIIVIGIFVLGFRGFLDMKEPRGDHYRIEVMAHSWRWEFTYEDGTRTTDVLHLPVDRNIRLVITTGDEDVIHSFFVPAFRIKQDAVPNLSKELWFMPTRTGIFDFYCTEYCGLEHSTMIGLVHVHTWEGFQRALADARVTPEDILPSDVRDAMAAIRADDFSIPDETVRESLLREFEESADRINAYFDYLTLTRELGLKAEEEARRTNIPVDPEDVAKQVAAQLKEKYAANEELVALIEKVADLMQPLWERGRLNWAVKGCSSCHTLDGRPGTGPTFKGIWGQTHQFTDGTSAVVDENYIRESILYPGRKINVGYANVMPSYQGTITDAEINSLIALIRHLGDEKTD